MTPLLLTGAALAGPWTLGVGGGVVKDLPDRISAEETAGFDLGPSLVGHARYALVDQLVDLRLSLELATGSGWDRLSWTEGSARFYDDDHWAMYTAGRVLLGPEVIVPTSPDPVVSPFFGVGVGPGWIGTFHSFTAATADLMDPAENDLDDKLNRDPHTSQWVAVAGTHVGVRFGRRPGMAVEVEAGYTVSHVGAAPLQKTLESYEAAREPWTLNTFRLGLGVANSF